MKTTILYYGRQEGKTNDLVEMVCEMPLTENILLLTHNNKEVKRLVDDFPSLTVGKIRVCSFHPKAIAQSVRGFTTEHLFIDNADYITTEAIKEVRTIIQYPNNQPRLKTLTVTGSDKALILHKLPQLLFGVKE